MGSNLFRAMQRRLRASRALRRDGAVVVRDLVEPGLDRYGTGGVASSSRSSGLKTTV